MLHKLKDKEKGAKGYKMRPEKLFYLNFRLNLQAIPTIPVLFYR